MATVKRKQKTTELTKWHFNTLVSGEMNQSALTKKLSKHFDCKSIQAELVNSFLVNDVISVHDALSDVNLNQENTVLPMNVAATARFTSSTINRAVPITSQS